METIALNKGTCSAVDFAFVNLSMNVGHFYLVFIDVTVDSSTQDFQNTFPKRYGIGIVCPAADISR